MNGPLHRMRIGLCLLLICAGCAPLLAAPERPAQGTAIAGSLWAERPGSKVDGVQVGQSPPGDEPLTAEFRARAADLLRIDLEVESIAPSFAQDEPLIAQHAILTKHIALVADDLETAASCDGELNSDSFARLDVGTDIAGLAADLLMVEHMGKTQAIRRATQPGVNRGLAWVWKGMRVFATDPDWAVASPEEVQEVLDKAEWHRDTVLRTAGIATVLRSGVTAASVTSTVVSLPQLWLSGRMALSRVATWMRGLELPEAGLQLATNGELVPSFVLSGSRGAALVLTDVEVAAIADAGRLPAAAWQLYSLAKGGGAAVPPVAAGNGGWKSSWVDDTGKNAEILRKNMERAGVKFQELDAAHHIVPGRIARAQRARNVLDKWHIDINGADNGVALSPALHRNHGLHSHAIIDRLTDRLTEAKTRAGVIEILENAATQMKLGQF